MDVWTDIQIDPYCVVIKKFDPKFIFDIAISGYPVGYLAVQVSGIRPNSNYNTMFNSYL